MERGTEVTLARRPAGRASGIVGRALVIPHPLDFDWRFTRNTVGLIWKIIASLANPQASVALLGTPSLASVERPADLGSITLFERNPSHYLSLADGITFTCSDVLRDPISSSAHSVVVADPPWYEPETIGFLWTASTLSSAGSYVLLSLPPVETRPGIEEERVRITAAAAGFGLELENLHEGVLRYRTPFFEANAMSAAGAAAQDDWRFGDLAIFRRADGARGERPVLEAEPVWIERALGMTRFKLHESRAAGFGSPVLRSIVEGDVLPSVSRRDPRRKDAQVWTSGNRVFGCDSTNTLAAIIDGIRAGEAPEIAIGMQLGRTLTSDEKVLVETASQQLGNVVKWESVEFRISSLGGISKLGPNRHRPTSLERAG
jgi:hypothetical protein